MSVGTKAATMLSDALRGAVNDAQAQVNAACNPGGAN